MSPNIGIVIYLKKLSSLYKYLNIIDNLKSYNLNVCFIDSNTLNIPFNDRYVQISSTSKSFGESINNGFKKLIELNPNIELFTFIEDGYFPLLDFIAPQILCLRKYPRLGLISPSIIDLKDSAYYSTWELNKDLNKPVSILDNSISYDKFVSIFKISCFSITKETLNKVGFLNENLNSSFFDIDLAIRLTKNKIRMVCSCDFKLTNTIGNTNSWVINNNLNLDKEIISKLHGDDISLYNKIQPKTIIECQIYNQDHLLKPWLTNACQYADEIIILFSEKPWQHNPNAGNNIKLDNSKAILQEFMKDNPKVISIFHDWFYETDERNYGVTLAKERGAKWLLIVDCDEFYIKEEIFNAFDYMLTKDVDIFVMNSVQLVKEKTWAALPEEGHPLCNFCIDLDIVPGFIATRIVSGTNVLIPYEICKCWHLSYLLPKEKLEQKLETSFHYVEFDPYWYRDVWPTININSLNFHPTHPKAWSRMIEVKIPEEILSTIPYLN